MQHLLGEVYLTRAGAATSSPDFALAAAKLLPWRTTPRFSLVPRVRGPVADRQRGQLGSRVRDPVHGRPAHHGPRQQARTCTGLSVRPRAGHAARHRQRPAVPPLPSVDVAARAVGSHDRFALRGHAQGRVVLEQPEQHPEERGRHSRSSRVGDTAVFFPGKATITAAERAATRYKMYAESEYQDAIFPVLNKYLDGTRTSTNQEEGQRDHPLMRLANTYLMLAEALMRDGKATEGSVHEQGAHARGEARARPRRCRSRAADLEPRLSSSTSGRASSPARPRAGSTSRARASSWSA